MPSATTGTDVSCFFARPSCHMSARSRLHIIGRLNRGQLYRAANGERRTKKRRAPHEKNGRRQEKRMERNHAGRAPKSIQIHPGQQKRQHAKDKQSPLCRAKQAAFQDIPSCLPADEP